MGFELGRHHRLLLLNQLEWIDQRFGTLVMDHPFVIETSLEQYGDIVFLDKESVIPRPCYVALLGFLLQMVLFHSLQCIQKLWLHLNIRLDQSLLGGAMTIY